MTKEALAAVMLFAATGVGGGCATTFNRDPPPAAPVVAQAQPQSGAVVGAANSSATDGAEVEGAAPRVAVPSVPPGPLPSQAPEAVVPPVYPPPPIIVVPPPALAPASP